MIVLDDAQAPLPYCIVSRADKLIARAQLPGVGFGMRVDWIHGEHPVEDATPPSLTFLGDKWPRMEYNIKNLAFKVDLLCRNHMVVQRMRITNESTRPQVFNMEFNPKFVLRDLDYMSSEIKVSIDCSPGPHDRSLVFMQQVPPTVAGLRIKVVVGLFKNGVAQELKDDSTQQIKHGISSKTMVEYLAVLKIQYGEPNDQ
ncbi:hypothetical protein BJY04DRAFT_224924 [Aspergillus karnatakaensis]|uniref:uncharacterized protein n=1 Tax=Aspergillus karnatakaensis TaxID=1810916 RepID=UPI003CCD0C57